LGAAEEDRASIGASVAHCLAVLGWLDGHGDRI